MATVNVSWTTAKYAPVAKDLSQYKASIDGIAPAQFLPFGTLAATFLDVNPGDYIARVALSNADGSVTEAEKSMAFTVPAPQLDAPDVISVNLA